MFNIDFDELKIKDKPVALDFIRIGTSGCLQKDIPLDSFLFSEFAVGLDNLFTFYNTVSDQSTINVQTDFQDFCERSGTPKYATIWHKVNEELMELLCSEQDFKGITLTCPGFYGPQGRELRLDSKLSPFINALSHFKSGERRFTNFEMETSGIYGMSHLLGHRAISCNALLANRQEGTFSTNPKKTVELLIKQVLERLVS